MEIFPCQMTTHGLGDDEVTQQSVSDAREAQQHMCLGAEFQENPDLL